MAVGEFFRNIFSGIITDMVIALVVLLIGIIIGRILGRLIQGIFEEIEFNTIMEKAGFRINFGEIIGNLVSYFIYFIAVIMALNQVSITKTVFNVISSAVIIIIILSLVLSFKDYLSNIMSGIFIRQKRIIKIGDRIKFKDIEGKIINTSLVETVIETKDKDIVYIPNSLLTKNSVKIK